MPNLPFVSIIVPCYNEESTIRHLLDSVLAQTYPREQMELVISDGMSTDHTRDVIAAFQNEHADLAVRVVDNSARTIPSGLNQAIREFAWRDHCPPGCTFHAHPRICGTMCRRA